MTHWKLPPDCILQVRNLRYSLNGREVLRNINLEIRKNEIIALLGASGSGKTLILKNIIGLKKPDSGQILFEDTDITQLSERELYPFRQKIGYVFQSGALFDSLTVEENLSYPLSIHTNLTPTQIQAEVNKRLKIIDMTGSNSLYPNELSGGMQRRISLTRATMLHQKIVLLDEPITGLDPAHVASFIQTLADVRKTQELSGILVTHDINAALAISERAAVLHDGFIHSVGSVSDIEQSNDPVIKQLLHQDYYWMRREGGIHEKYKAHA